tara:strand:- start:8645 stop:9157 length:513 start_codon:yes stop_codon:yes gene_type:complete
MLTKKERLEQYGVTSNMQVLSGIQWVCDVFGNGSNNNAKLLLEKTIRHESKLGNYKDSSEEYGESTSQIDPDTFYWLKEKLSKKNYLETRQLFHKHFGFPLSTLEYEDLRTIPNTGIFLCRMRYKFVPEAIPTGSLGQYEYYKKYWNGNGAATLKKWNNDTKDCFFVNRD